jgi:hypothetical protein
VVVLGEAAGEEEEEEALSNRHPYTYIFSP